MPYGDSVLVHNGLNFRNKLSYQILQHCSWALLPAQILRDGKAGSALGRLQSSTMPVNDRNVPAVDFMTILVCVLQNAVNKPTMIWRAVGYRTLTWIAGRRKFVRGLPSSTSDNIPGPTTSNLLS